MNKEQQRRARVLSCLSCGAMNKTDAQRLLGLSRRQVNRALKAYQDRGLESVVHANTGRAPANKTDEEIVDKIRQMAGEEGMYHGFNTCHLHDMLRLNEEIRIGRSTISRLLGKERPGRSDRSRQVKRRRRLRSSAEGMMLQIDGSPHNWLEDRGPRMSLVGAVDDATGKIIYASFRPTEDAPGYLMMMRQITLEYGLPCSFYHDRHTILCSPKEPTIEEELLGRKPMSQIQRIMEELGVESIAAHSPQAKGRIERLWGVLQDRLVKEMRAAGIMSLEQANDFLPDFIDRFNQRFAVEPADPNPAWVEVGPELDVDYYFSIRESRVVRTDHTIAWFGSTIQILRDKRQMSLAGKKVWVHVTPEEKLVIYEGKIRLEYELVKHRPRPLPEPPKPQKEKLQPDPLSLKRQRAWLFQRTPAQVA